MFLIKIFVGAKRHWTLSSDTDKGGIVVHYRCRAAKTKGPCLLKTSWTTVDDKSASLPTLEYVHVQNVVNILVLYFWKLWEIDNNGYFFEDDPEPSSPMSSPPMKVPALSSQVFPIKSNPPSTAPLKVGASRFENRQRRVSNRTRKEKSTIVRES